MSTDSCQEASIAELNAEKRKLKRDLRTARLHLGELIDGLVMAWSPYMDPPQSVGDRTAKSDGKDSWLRKVSDESAGRDDPISFLGFQLTFLGSSILVYDSRNSYDMLVFSVACGNR